MRKEKEYLLREIEEQIRSASSVVVASYGQLSPNLSWQMRDALGKAGAHFEVVRKAVFVKAADRVGITVDVASLKGHVGVLFVRKPDAIPATKALHQFSEANGGLLQMLFGRIEGKEISSKDLAIFATLPGMEEMRATLLGLFTSPMSQMLSVLEAAISQKSASEGE
ncbi:MAG: 50S ribosomal protein L10 [Verrucomicrobiota bacterium]|nr:50S ribosomal protein L10 [Verrucomicrobiota bacterium]